MVCFEVENTQIGSLKVKLGRFRVTMVGLPTSPSNDGRLVFLELLGILHYEKLI